MNKSSNVIDLKPHLNKAKGQKSPEARGHTAVVDMTERRNLVLGEERRKVKRTILTEFVGAFMIIPERGLMRVALYDISDDGLAFDLDEKFGEMAEGEEIAVRVYLNNSTYFPFSVRITNARLISEEGVSRHGARFVKGTVNDKALHHFVKFIETVSASLETDHGDVMVSNISR